MPAHLKSKYRSSTGSGNLRRRVERSYAHAQRELQRLQKSRLPVDPPNEDDEENWETLSFSWYNPDDPDAEPAFPPIILTRDPQGVPSTG